jgi:hypothetical protein
MQLRAFLRQIDEMSSEDKQGLLAHLIHSLHNVPMGASDEEILKRDEEMESGHVQPISHKTFLDLNAQILRPH